MLGHIPSTTNFKALVIRNNVQQPCRADNFLCWFMKYHERILYSFLALLQRAIVYLPEFFANGPVAGIKFPNAFIGSGLVEIVEMFFFQRQQIHNSSAKNGRVFNPMFF